MVMSSAWTEEALGRQIWKDVFCTSHNFFLEDDISYLSAQINILKDTWNELAQESCNLQ